MSKSIEGGTETFFDERTKEERKTYLRERGYWVQEWHYGGNPKAAKPKTSRWVLQWGRPPL